MTTRKKFLVLVSCVLLPVLAWELYVTCKPNWKPNWKYLPFLFFDASSKNRSLPVDANGSLTGATTSYVSTMPLTVSTLLLRNHTTGQLLETSVSFPRTSPRMWTHLTHSSSANQLAVSDFSTKPLSFSRSYATEAVTNGQMKVTLSRHTGSKVVCVRFIGRLGNQLFQYASVLGIARKTNRIPVFLGKSILSDVLRNTSLIENSVQYATRCKEAHIKEKGACKFFKGFFELNSNKDYTVEQYLQSWRYFVENETDLRQAIKFKDVIVSQALRTVDSLRQKHNKTLTGVHVRRGDYLMLEHKGYLTAPVKFLLNAMDYVRKRFGDVVFVVSSDDVEWCRVQFGNASDVTVLQDHPSPAVDMMVLASLDHMIMTVGSYGWWASFLNPGITVYYRDFVKAGTSLSNQFNPNGTDYYCPGWIPLS